MEVDSGTCLCRITKFSLLPYNCSTTIVFSCMKVVKTSQQNYATNLEQFAPYVGSLGDVGWFRYTGAVHMKVVKVGKSGQFLSS